jgi:AraC-like DNA-binding protein
VVSAGATGLTLPPTAGGGISRAAYARAKEAGLDVGPLLKAAHLNLEQIEDAAVRIGVHSQIRLVDLIADALPDAFLGMRLALEVDMRELGLLYYVQASSETLGQALQRLSRYVSIQHEGVHIRYSAGKDVSIVFEYVNVGRLEDRHQIEFFVTLLVRTCRHFCNRRISPACIRLAHRRAGIPPDLKAFFGCEVLFGNAVDEVVYQDTIATLPLVNADPYLNLLLLKYCEEALSERSRTAKSWRSAVENAIVPLLPHGEPGIAEIAKRLSMGRRTLARRLADEGSSFKDVLERLRFDLAKRYITEPDLPIGEIAWLLGYAQPSAFHHAFKRWSGHTPRQMRRRALDASRVSASRQ